MNSDFIYKSIGFKRIYIAKDKSENVEKEDTTAFLGAFYETCKSCKKCKLSEQRTQVVFGDGNPSTGILFVGEAPGADEDKEGKPFVGKAGKLLTNVLEGIGLLRKRDYYITNVVKCRPPENRTPEDEEMLSCSYILKEEIKLIKPKLIVALGKTAAVGLIGTKQISPTKSRGSFLSSTPKSPVLPAGTKVFITYHPSFLLRNPNELNHFKEDLLKVKTLIETL